MVASGVLFELIRDGVQFIPFRNIDNVAEMFNEDFLAMLGIRA